MYYTNRNELPQKFTDSSIEEIFDKRENIDVKLHLYGRINYLWREYCSDQELTKEML
jgi:hypothetical protein